MPTARFQASFAGGVIAPGLHARVEQQKYDIGLKVGKNVFVHAYGGVSNRAGFEYIGEVMDHSVVHRLIPFERDDNENYILVLGDEEMKIIQNGAYLETGPGVDYNPSTPFAESILFDLNYAQSVDVMYFAHPSFYPTKMERSGATTYSFGDINVNPTSLVEDWLDLSGASGNPPTSVAVTVDSGFDSTAGYRDYTYVVTATYGGVESPACTAVTVTHAPFDNDLPTYPNVLTWDAMAGATGYTVYRWTGSMYEQAGTTVTNSFTDNNTTLTSTNPPTPITATPSAVSTKTYRYTITAVINGVETFALPPVELLSGDISAAGVHIDLSWSAYAESYNVYKERNNVYGYIGFTEDESFRDDGIGEDLTLTPPQASGVFHAAGYYPSTVALYQQRLVFGGSTSEPETVIMSRVGDFENFTRSKILKDDDRVKLDITSNSINRIRSMTQLRELLVFTSNGEFAVSGPNGVMLATNPVQTQYGYAGNNGLRPLIIEDTMLFVDRTGRQVRDLRYAFEQDGYSGNDLTIWAEHYFRGKEIVDWAYQRNPYSIVWAVLDDGTLLSFTYKREHQVWAWTEHDIAGSVESVAVIREGSEDALYAIIARTIGGQTKRYVERLHTREFTDVEDFFGVDSGVTYEGAATTTITGLSHLEGETVTALADGAVVANLTVTSGQVTLPIAASTVHVGLPYTAELETLPPSIDVQYTGNTRGRPVKAAQVYLQLERTRGIEVAPTSRSYAALVLPTSDLSVPGDAVTGMERITLQPDWNTDGTIVVRQTNPLPMTILGISPDYAVGQIRKVES